MRVLISLVALLLVGVGAAAQAEEDVEAHPNSFAAIAHTEVPMAAQDGAAQAHSDGTTYYLEPACAVGEGVTGPESYGCRGQVECDGAGLMYFVWATHADGSAERVGTQCVSPGEAPAAATVTADAVLRAFRRIPLPESEVAIQPPGGETLVNLDTVFSTEADGFTRTVGLLGHRVELDIWASEFRWVTGDGEALMTDWAGKPWRRGTALGELITYRYEDARKGLRPRVDTTWSARYRVDGGPWRDVPGTVTIEGEPYDLVVRSAQPHLTG